MLPDLILLIWSNSAWKESVTRFYFTKLATTFCFCTSLKGKRLWFSTFWKQVSTMPKLNHHKSKSVDTKSNFGIEPLEPWDPSIMSTLLMYVDMCTYTEQIGFSRSWRVQVISDFLTRTTTRMAAKTKDAIIWKGERGAKQNKWLFWVMCRALALLSYLFPVFYYRLQRKRTLETNGQKSKRNKTTFYSSSSNNCTLALQKH